MPNKVEQAGAIITIAIALGLITRGYIYPGTLMDKILRMGEGFLIGVTLMALWAAVCAVAVFI